MPRLLGPAAVLVTVKLACIVQILRKQQLLRLGPVPSAVGEWPRYTLLILFSCQIISGFAVAFVGAMIYLFAISRLNITYLYPFASLSVPAVLLAGVFVLGESFSWQKALGSALIVPGAFISAASQN